MVLKIINKMKILMVIVIQNRNLSFYRCLRAMFRKNNGNFLKKSLVKNYRLVILSKNRLKGIKNWLKKIIIIKIIIKMICKVKLSRIDKFLRKKLLLGIKVGAEVGPILLK